MSGKLRPGADNAKHAEVRKGKHPALAFNLIANGQDPEALWLLAREDGCAEVGVAGDAGRNPCAHLHFCF
jgi:hypothetical protein